MRAALLHRTVGDRRLQREAVDVGPVEARHVDRRKDVVCEYAADARRPSGTFSRAERAKLQMLLEARGRLVASDDGQELRLTRIVLHRWAWPSVPQS